MTTNRLKNCDSHPIAVRRRAPSLWVLLLLIICCAAALVMVLTPGAPNANEVPALVASEGSLDIGCVWMSASHQHLLTFVNDSNRSIEVEEMRASCGCITIQPSSFELHPGASASVALTIDLRFPGLVVSQDQDTGIDSVQLKVVAFLKDGSRAEWKLGGQVKRSIDVSPSFISFSGADELVAGVPSKAELEVQLYPGVSRIVAHCDPLLGTVKCFALDDGVEARKWRVVLTASGRHPPGQLEDTLTLVPYSEVDNEPLPTLAIPVHGTVNSSVYSIPSVLVIPNGQAARHAIVLQSRGNRSFEIESTEVPDGFVATISGDGSMTRATVIVQHPGEHFSEADKRTLTFVVSDSDSGTPETVVVPIVLLK